jgi:hypothetical protein
MVKSLKAVEKVSTQGCSKTVRCKASEIQRKKSGHCAYLPPTSYPQYPVLPYLLPPTPCLFPLGGSRGVIEDKTPLLGKESGVFYAGDW